MNDERIERLQNIEIFSLLEFEEIREIAPRVAFREVAKNEVILQEEDTNSFMYAVISGKVKVFQSTEDGKEAVLAIHGEGRLFGELSLIDGKTSPATVVATEDSVIALISKKDFDALLGHHKFLQSLLVSLCGRLRDSWKRIHMLGQKNAEERIRMLMLLMSEESGAEPCADGITIAMRLTHQSMADMTGLTRETVTRVMDKWVKKGEISLDDQKRICLRKGFLKKNFQL